MSKEGIFQLYHNTVNESNLNKLLTARKLLTDRIEIIMEKSNDSNDNLMKKMPFLINQSHVFMLDSLYKPMVAMGQDWTPSPAMGNKPGFNKKISFTPPKYGDF